MKKILSSIALLTAACCAAAGETGPVAIIQPPTSQPAAAAAALPVVGSQPEALPTLSAAGRSIEQQLIESREELDRLYKSILDARLPLSNKLHRLEGDVLVARQQVHELTGKRDSLALGLTQLNTDLKRRQEEASYLGNLFNEYTRNLEPRLHIAETQRYQQYLDASRNAPDNPNLSQQQILETQAALISRSLERLTESLDGLRFNGTAVATGDVKDGSFLIIGPAALFRSADGQVVGAVEQRLGSLEPQVRPFQDPDQTAAAAALLSGDGARFPFDPTQGNAWKVESTKETIVQHFLAGGPVMWPILAVGAIALMVALFKWLSMAMLRNPSKQQISLLMIALERGERATARKRAAAMRGPVGKMLTVGMEHIHEPRELVEEIMYETVLSTKLRLNRLLPFLALSASSAPLLGLLGTVTGIIGTFKMMTVYGSGDIKTLSSGISEALITTECGLYVAIPSLLIYAFLARKARACIDQMEKTAIMFVNQISKSQSRASAAIEQPKDATVETVENSDGREGDEIIEQAVGSTSAVATA